MRRLALAAASAALALAGCGGGGSHTTTTSSSTTPHPSPASSCPQAANGHGHPGVCAPPSLKLGQPHKTPPFPPGLAAPVRGVVTFDDLSNNDPCFCGAAMKARGRSGLIVKANQGVRFVDSTAVGMVASARRAGLAVGAYDFDQDYTVGEAQVFVARLHAMGIFPNTPNTFPAYLDVEFGSFNYGGLLAQIAYVRAQGYRVGIYTGDWYWGPHVGCRWPGLSAWISGYPSAIVPCGLGLNLYEAHQYTDKPVDTSVFLPRGKTFAQFVRSASPPDPFRLYVKTRFVFAHGKVHASEYNTVRTAVLRGCRQPARREVCKSTFLHLRMLLGRIYFVAFHTRDLKHAVKHARWRDYPGHELGLRAAGIRVLLARK